MPPTDEDKERIQEFIALTKQGELRWTDETFSKQCFCARQFGYKLTLKDYGQTLIFEEYCGNPQRVIDDKCVFPLLEAVEIQCMDRAAEERRLDREFEKQEQKFCKRNR